MGKVAKFFGGVAVLASVIAAAPAVAAMQANDGQSVRDTNPIRPWARDTNPIRPWARDTNPIRPWARDTNPIRPWARDTNPIRPW